MQNLEIRVEACLRDQRFYLIHAGVYLGWGECCSCPRQQSPRGGKVNMLNEKNWFSVLNKFYIIETNKR
jgi:hypothetical protein